MAKLTKSLLLLKERNCYVSIVLDRRTRRKNATEFPLALRFTIGRKIFYYHISGSYTDKRFSEICNAKHHGSENYKIREKWIGTYKEKFQKMLEGISPAELLDYNSVKQMVTTGKIDRTSSEPTSFIEVWEDYIHDLKTENNGEHYANGSSHECSLNSFKRILGVDNSIGFNVGAPLLQRWKDGMRNGVRDANGKLFGKIRDATAGIYLRNSRAIWNICQRKGYMEGKEYPFGKSKDGSKVSIPVGAKRKALYLTVDQMTQLYNVFITKNYPESWKEKYKKNVHWALGLFLAQYLCNGFNLADAAELKYDDYYYQSGQRGFRFNRKKTAKRSADGSEVFIPIIEPLRKVLDEVAAKPRRGALVFPEILNGVTLEKDKLVALAQQNANIRQRVQKICHEVLGWDESIKPSGTWCRHSFATNLCHAGVDLNYISECMGHATYNNIVTQMYIEHYPLEVQMRNNSKLLNLGDKTVDDEKEQLIAKLSSLSPENLQKLQQILQLIG